MNAASLITIKTIILGSFIFTAMIFGASVQFMSFDKGASSITQKTSSSVARAAADNLSHAEHRIIIARARNY